MKEALIIIDCQEDFFTNTESRLFNQETLVQNINALIISFRQRNKPIIFIRHTDEDLLAGTQPWEIYSEINTGPGDIYIDKTTPDSFFQTGLAGVLRENRIDTLVIAGLQTDYCIDTTCRSAFGKGLSTVLVSDGHSTYDNSFMQAGKIIEYHNKIIGRWFAKLKSTKELIGWQSIQEGPMLK